MLTITIPSAEGFDENINEFFQTKEQTIVLEHSLVSISKWEAKWKKPFLSKEAKTSEEIIDYIKCMTLTQNVDPNVYNFISSDIFAKIESYINEPMTATWFNEDPNAPKSREIITSELIYYWMIAFSIPFECQKWHLNRLLTLIRVCNIKNTPSKKMSKSQILNRNKNLNAARRKVLNTKG